MSNAVFSEGLNWIKLNGIPTLFISVITGLIIHFGVPYFNFCLEKKKKVFDQKIDKKRTQEQNQSDTASKIIITTEQFINCIEQNCISHFRIKKPGEYAAEYIVYLQTEYNKRWNMASNIQALSLHPFHLINESFTQLLTMSSASFDQYSEINSILRKIIQIQKSIQDAQQDFIGYQSLYDQNGILDKAYIEVYEDVRKTAFPKNYGGKVFTSLLEEKNKLIKLLQPYTMP